MSTAANRPSEGAITVSATIDGRSVPGQPTSYEWKEMAFIPAAFTADEVPVAARVRSSYTFPSVRGDGTADIRTLDGNFFSQKMTMDATPLTAATPYLGDYIRLHFGGHDTAEEATVAMLAGSAGIINIDGQLWNRIDEPRLVVHPHGIWIDVVPHAGINPQVSAFALTDSDQAVARAAELRLETGTGTKPYPTALNPEVTVLIPSAFTECKPGQGAVQSNAFRPDSKTIPPELKAKLHRRINAGDSTGPAEDQ